MSAKKKKPAQQQEHKDVLQQVKVLFQSRGADLTMREEDRVASPDIVLMCASDMKTLGLRAGKVVSIDTDSGVRLWCRCWSSAKLIPGHITLNRAWWPNFTTNMDERFTTVSSDTKGMRSTLCTKASMRVLSNSANVARKVIDSAQFFAHVSSWLTSVPVSEGTKIGITFKGSPVVLQFGSLEGRRGATTGAAAVAADGGQGVSDEERTFTIDYSSALVVTTKEDEEEEVASAAGAEDSVSIAITAPLVTKKALSLRDLGFGGYAKQSELASSIVKKGLGTSQSKSSSSSSLLFKRPKGLLLHGPPGTGKSLLAKSLVRAAGCAYVELSHGVLLSLVVGDAEREITRVFEEARRRAPCAVLLEDADLLCRSRGHATSTSMHKSVVSCLLTLIDGLKSKSSDNKDQAQEDRPVFLVATSARPGDLDPAMRRPGRLDAEVELPAPSGDERREILGCILRGMQAVCVKGEGEGDGRGGDSANGSVTEDDIAVVAAAAHGMVGSDLLQVAKEAFLVAAQGFVNGRSKAAGRGAAGRKLLQNYDDDDDDAEVDNGNGSDPIDAITAELGAVSLRDSNGNGGGTTMPPSPPRDDDEGVVRINGADLRAALVKVPPSAIREVVVEVPCVRWTDIGGMHSVKTGLQEVVEWPLRYPQMFRDLGVSPAMGVLLYGPPGCSKTLMAKALATESGMNFLSVRGPELLSKWLGESEKAVQTLFRRARAASPCIVFFDEIDALAGSRGTSSTGVSDRVLAQLLTELDGASSNRHHLISGGGAGRVIVVAATNRPDVLDAALMRPGRIDKKIYVPPPDEASREQILRLQLGKMPVEPGVLSDDGISQLVGLSDGYSGAEVVALASEAAMLALDADRDEVLMSDLTEAGSGISPQITASMLDFYARFRDSL
jgi:AAA family ATPase